MQIFKQNFNQSSELIKKNYKQFGYQWKFLFIVKLMVSTQNWTTKKQN